MSHLFNKKDIKFFKSLIIKAGDLAHNIQRENLYVSRKEDSSIVTDADLSVQDLLLNKISRKYKDINFISEESSNNKFNKIDNDEISVIVDPIDGTAMFSMYLPFWCVSVGIFQGYKPVYGFVYSPGSHMLFYNDDEFSYLNNEKVNVRKDLEIERETNIFYASEVKFHKLNFPGKVRNLGSTALHACLTVDNRRNRVLAFIGKVNLWDWAGAIPIILKANGNIKYLSGKKIDYKEIFNNNFRLTDYAVAYNTDDFNLIKKIFKDCK
ncbi:inositol monophosphatase family protein [Spirochaetota bacterium]